MKRDPGYYWWRWRVWYPGRLRWHLKETLPCKIAWLLPRKVAYFAFVRVYSVLGYCGPDYAAACDEWERRGRGPRRDAYRDKTREEGSAMLARAKAAEPSPGSVIRIRYPHFLLSEQPEADLKQVRDV